MREETHTPIKQASEPLSRKEKISYGVADMGFTLSFTTVALYLFYFYTDVFGISAAAAGMVMLVTRIWDAANDPLMGYISDHTTSRWGRFRPYMLYGSFPLVITTILLFTAFDLSSTGKFIYALVTFTLYTMAYTATNIPYSALTAVMTKDYNERASLSAIRLFFSTGGSAVTAVLTIPLVGLFASERTGFSMVNVIFGVMVVALFLTTFANIRERVDVSQKESYTLKHTFRALGGNGPLAVLGVVFFLMYFGWTIRAMTGIYFIKYNLGREDLIPLFLLIGMIATLIGMTLISPVVRKLGKKKLFVLGAALGLLCMTPIYFVPYDNIPLLLALFAGLSFFSAAPLACAWAMIPDIVDYGEWKTGLRADGVINSVFCFCFKAAMAASGAVVGAIMTVTGYMPNVEQISGALQGIRHMIVGIPALSYLVMTLVLLFCYRLDAQKSAEINQEVTQRVATHKQN